jgi:arylsulfatase A-like enzyme
MKYTYILILALFIAGCAQKAEQQNPNIIFLLTDDQRADAMGVAGNTIIQTPNLDKLANDGIRFANAFVTSSICCISRASVFSGQYLRRHTIDDFATSFTDQAWSETYPALLKEAGYKMGFIGKFGVGREDAIPKETFDYWQGFGGQGRFETTDDEGNFVHLTEKMGNQALEFIRDYSGEGPFCLSVSFKAPHCQDGDARQFIFNPEYSDILAETTIPEEPTNKDEIYELFPEEWRRDNEGRARWKIRFSTPEQYQEMVKGYYRLVYGVDVVVGRIRAELEKTGLDDNTVIIFSGDNGFYLGEHGLAGKWYGHEESIRVPFLVYDPRSSENGIVKEQMALNIDIAPTILDLANIDKPEQMQGESVLRLTEGADEWRTDFFYEHPVFLATGYSDIKGGETRNIDIPGIEGIIGSNYKYIRYFREPGDYIYEELFDRKNDQSDLSNLAVESEFSELKVSYAKKIEDYIENLK